MPHLTAEEFVDLAEGARLDASAPHLAACEACRRELAGLRAMMSEAAAVEVPEPSPLFWDHFSARMRNAVSAEPALPRTWRRWIFTPQVAAPAVGAAFAMALAAVLWPHPLAAPALPATPLSIMDSSALPASSPSLPPLAPLGASDDPELRLVAASATTDDWDEMRDEVALATGSSSDAVAGALSAAEQRELQRLLARELAQAGAPEGRS